MKQPEWQPLAGPYRRYPARADQQRRPADERTVCSRCLGGTCCSSEGPIALAAFDVLRLAAALGLAPGEFLTLFTQDRFEGAASDAYRQWLDDEDTSVVTFLRRRTLAPNSPCIFLKYVHETDGTPRRVCSVHPARPLACREYYHDTCKKRWTGELAVLQAIGYEAVREGSIGPADIDGHLARSGSSSEAEPIGRSWRRAFWHEMRRAVHSERANHEGSADPRLAEHQDDLSDKMNRLLSRRYLRFEEKYGPEPCGEQLQRFDAGLSLVDSGEGARLRAIASTPPGPAPLFEPDGYPHYIGTRWLMREAPATAVSGARDSHAEACAFLWEELRRFARHVQRIPDLMELEAADALPFALFDALRRVPSGLLPGDGARELARWSCWSADLALKLGVQSLRSSGAELDPQIEALGRIGRLASLGHAGARSALRRLHATPLGRYIESQASARWATWRSALPRPAQSQLVWVQGAGRLGALRGPEGVAAQDDLLGLVVGPRRATGSLSSAARLRLLDFATGWRTTPKVRYRDAADWLRRSSFPATETLRAAALAVRLGQGRDLDAIAADLAAASIWDRLPDEIDGSWHDEYVLASLERAARRAEIIGGSTRPAHRGRALPETGASARTTLD